MIIEGEKLYGIAKRNSCTSMKLSQHIVKGTENGKYVKILIPNELRKGIHLKNKAMSIVGPAMTFMVILFAVSEIALQDIGFRPSK